MPYPAGTTYPGGVIYPGGEAPPVEPPETPVVNLLRPNADGDKAEWDEVPAGAAWSCLDDAVTAPSVPTTTDRIETATPGEISRIRFDTFTPTRSVVGVSAYSYMKPGSVTARADLHTRASGDVLLEQGAAVAALTGGIEFGFNEDYDQWYATGGHQAGAPVAAAMGATYARVPIYWFNHEPTEGNYVWNFYIDGPYGAILAAGMRPLLCVMAAPGWAGDTPPSNHHVPRAANIDSYAAFVAELQDQYPEALIQAWNEANYSIFNGLQLGPAHFAAMTNAASEAIQPNPLIAPSVTPGGEQGPVGFYNTMWDAITEEPYVKASAHLYPSGPGWQQNIADWLVRLNERTPGQGWITEAGIHRDLHGGNTNQDNRSKTMYQMCSDAGIEGLIYHRFRTSNQNTFEVEGDFGIVNLALSGSSFVPNGLYDALEEARDDDPNVGQTTNYRWVETRYVGALTQAEINALEIDFVSGGTAGAEAAEVAATYLLVELLPIPLAPTKQTLVVGQLRDGALERSHRVVTRVDVLRHGAKVAEIDAVIGGAVTLDANSASRGRLELQVIDDGTMGWVPKEAGDYLAPFGNELRVYRGIEFGDQIEIVPLGVFGIDRVSTQDTGTGIEVSVSGLDRSWRFIQAPFEAPYEIGGDATELSPGDFPAGAKDAIIITLREAWPDMPYDAGDFGGLDALLPRIRAEEGEDRWAFCQGIATALGGELFFDDNGILRLIEVSDAGGPPVSAYAEGIDGILLGVNRDWDRANVYNRVIVTGENAALEGAAIPRGVATDLDPASPTRYNGDFGRKPYFWASDEVADDAAAKRAAENLLARVIGAPDMISFGSVVDPAQRPGDIITIERPLSVPAGSEKHILDQVTIPLGAEGEMSGQTRVAQILITD